MTQRSLGSLVAITRIDRSGAKADLAKLRGELAAETLEVTAQLQFGNTSSRIRDIREEIAALSDQSTRALQGQTAAARTVAAEYNAVSASLRAEQAELRTAATRQASDTATASQAARERIALLRSEQATAREAGQTVNQYRIAWQRKTNDDQATTAIMAKLEASILRQRAALETEAQALRDKGVLDLAETQRLQALVAMQNTYSQALRTTASVQMQIAGEVMPLGPSPNPHTGIGGNHVATPRHTRHPTNRHKSTPTGIRKTSRSSTRHKNPLPGIQEKKSVRIGRMPDLSH